jgi:hypothetical protein
MVSTTSRHSVSGGETPSFDVVQSLCPSPVRSGLQHATTVQYCTTIIVQIGSTAWGTIEFALCAEEGRIEKENLLLIVEQKRNKKVRKIIYFFKLE